MFYNNLAEHIRERKRLGLQIDLNRKDIVLNNLVFLYHACVASEGLLIDAAAESQRESHFVICHYYRDHLNEEKGELEILEQDLDSEGIDTGMADRFVMAMIGTQYYLIKHVHPVSLLGYMAVQEADPTPIKVIERLEDLYGKNLFRFMRLHAVKDLEHRKEIIELIDACPEQLQPLIAQSADNALDHYCDAVKSWYG